MDPESAKQPERAGLGSEVPECLFREALHQMVHLVALAKGARLRSWPLDARQHGHHAAARARRRARRQSRSPRRRVACAAHIDARGRKSTMCSRARVCSGRVHTARMRWIKRASQAAHLTLERSCHGTCVAWLRVCASGHASCQ